MKNILKRAFIIFFCTVLFLGLSYAYLSYNFSKRSAAADQKEYDVPYERLPQNAGVAFTFDDGSAILAHLDFEDECIRLLSIDDFEGDSVSYSGYFADYTVEVSYSLVSGIIDRVGGINLNLGEESLRYTGSQVVELISKGYDSGLKREILLKIFEQISKNAFSKDDLVYIIENSKSNLSIIDCLYWLEYLKKMSSKISFVN